MQVGRATAAHVAAMLVAQVMIFTGMQAIRFGPSELLSGFTMSLAGFLIFLIVSVLTLPIGLLLRWLAGKLTASPLRISVSVGVIVGLATIPLLHPAMAPSISLGTRPVELLVLHALAGACGGYVWYYIERPNGGREHA